MRYYITPMFLPQDGLWPSAWIWDVTDSRGGWVASCYSSAAAERFVEGIKR